MEINDCRGIIVAHPHIVYVVDRAVAGKCAPRGLDGLDAFRGLRGAVRQFRIDGLDMVSTSTSSQSLADVALQHAGTSWAPQAPMSPSTSRSMPNDHFSPRSSRDIGGWRGRIAAVITMLRSRTLSLSRTDRHRGEVRSADRRALADGFRLRGLLESPRPDRSGMCRCTLDDGIDESVGPTMRRAGARRRPLGTSQDVGGGLLRCALRRRSSSVFGMVEASEPQAQDRIITATAPWRRPLRPKEEKRRKKLSPGRLSTIDYDGDVAEHRKRMPRVGCQRWLLVSRAVHAAPAHAQKIHRDIESPAPRRDAESVRLRSLRRHALQDSTRMPPSITRGMAPDKSADRSRTCRAVMMFLSPLSEHAAPPAR